MNENIGKKEIISALSDKKGENIVAIDLSETSSVADLFILVTANSDVHMRTLRQTVEELIKSRKIEFSVEGQNSTQWCLVDIGNIVLHIFSKKARTFYSLERIWGDSPTESYEYEM